MGPWAGLVSEEQRRAQLEAEALERQKIYTTIQAEKTQLENSETLPETEDKTDSLSARVALKKNKVTTIFHLNSETNFQGLSWYARPPGFEPRDQSDTNYLPKK